jgi:predicted transport protein
MSDDKIEKFFCNRCSGITNHFVRGEYNRDESFADESIRTYDRLLIVECCGCENLALVKMTATTEDLFYYEDPDTKETMAELIWDKVIYPPVTYRAPPTWFEDVPDPTLRQISEEIYKSLQTESNYLATFGSRTLIDRLILLTVGDKGNFVAGLNALQDEGKISQHERDILQPVIQAGHAAAHRGWAPTREQLTTILDTVEGLIRRLLVLPKLAEELEGAVPGRDGVVAAQPNQRTLTMKDKIESAPDELKEIYDELVTKLNDLGDDVTVHPQKHYIAFRRNRNFASVQIYNQIKVVRVYLNIDPDGVEIDAKNMRDVRQIGHFGTGDLEITITSKRDIEIISELIQSSYANS